MTARNRATSSSGEKGTVEDVVHARVEGRQLRREVAAPRQGDHRDAVGGRRGIAEPLEDRAVGEVHVDDGEMGTPGREHGQGGVHLLRDAREVGAVAERQPGVLGEHGLVDHQQDACGVAEVADRGVHGWPVLPARDRHRLSPPV